MADLVIPTTYGFPEDATSAAAWILKSCKLDIKLGLHDLQPDRIFCRIRRLMSAIKKYPLILGYGELHRRYKIEGLSL